jgi:hypothetical protein
MSIQNTTIHKADCFDLLSAEQTGKIVLEATYKKSGQNEIVMVGVC